MAVEAAVGKSTSKKFFSPLKRVERIAFAKAVERGWVDKFATWVCIRLPDVVKTDERTPEFTARFLDLTSKNMVPLIYGGHFDHFDPIIESHLCTDLVGLAREAGYGDKFNNVVATLAKSVPEGKQSTLMQVMYSYMEDYANKRDTEFFAITRHKDADIFDMELSMDEIRQLRAGLNRKGTGALILPGGRVEAGRHEKGKRGDQIKGLQEIGSKQIELISTFRTMDSVGKELGQEPYFQPVYISRSYRFFSSDSLWPTPEGLVSLSPRWSQRLGRLGFERMYMRVGYGMPITKEDIAKNVGSNWKKNTGESIDFLMRKAAKHNLPHERGFYG